MTFNTRGSVNTFQMQLQTVFLVMYFVIEDFRKILCKILSHLILVKLNLVSRLVS